MNFLLKSVRKRLSLSATSSSSLNSQEASLLSKSLDDIHLAPKEENDGADMVFYCKMIGTESVADRNGSELPTFVDKVIKSFNEPSSSAAAGNEPRKKVTTNKTMIRVNADGLELATDGSTEKWRFKLNHISYVSSAFVYTHCAAVICQSQSSPTNWRAYLLLFSKPKYARSFAVFLAKQFDAGYEKWQSEQPQGTLDIAVEQEAIQLKSKLKRGICNKTFVPDDDDYEAMSAMSTTPTLINQTQLPASTNSDPQSNETAQSSVQKQLSGSPTNPKSSVPPTVISKKHLNNHLERHPSGIKISSTSQPRRLAQLQSNWNEPSNSVPQHLLDSKEGHNEFTNAESELCFKRSLHQNEQSPSSPNLYDEVFPRHSPWALSKDPFSTFFESANTNARQSSSNNSLFKSQLSNGNSLSVQSNTQSSQRSSYFNQTDDDFMLEM